MSGLNVLRSLDNTVLIYDMRMRDQDPEVHLVHFALSAD